MGWVWRDETEDDDGADPRNDAISLFGVPESKTTETGRCSTRRIVKSQCRTEEVEPGKFIRKCEKTEQFLKDCLGRPAEVVQSNKEYTEEDVTNEILNTMPSFVPFSHSDDSPFGFPGLRTDKKSIERSFFNNMKSAFDAFDEITNGIFGAFGTPNIGESEDSTPFTRPAIPVEKDSPPRQHS